MNKAQRKAALRREVAHLDDVELDGAWESALRGDLDSVEVRLQRVRDRRTRPSDDEKGSPWRRGSSWLFGRKAYRRE